MSEDETHASEVSKSQRKRALELADSLREIAAACSSADLGLPELDAALDLTQQLREKIGHGPPVRRWYEQDARIKPRGPDKQISYLDHSPIRGALNPIAPPLRLETVTNSAGETQIIGHARLGIAYEGPPHGVHGGWVAALFDETLGAVQALDDSIRVTAILKIRYREITPINEDLRFTGWIAELRGGRRVVKATCHARDRLTADAEAIFIEVDLDEIREHTVPQ